MTSRAFSRTLVFYGLLCDKTPHRNLGRLDLTPRESPELIV